MKKLFSGFLGLSLATAVFANQAVSTQKSENLLGFDKSKLGLTLDTETDFVSRKDESSFSSYATNLFPTLRYSLNENQSVSVYGKYVFATKDSNAEEIEYAGSSEYVAYRFDQKNILTQDKDGVDFTANLRYYNYVNDDKKMAMETDGILNVRAYLSKKFNDKWSVNNEFRHYIHNNVDNASNSATATLTTIEATPEYTIDDKSSVYATLYYDVTTFEAAKSTKNFALAPGFGHKVSKKLTAYLDLETTLFADSGNGSFKRQETNLNVIPNLSYAANDKLALDFQVVAPLYDGKGKYDLTNMRKNLTAKLELHLTAF